MAIIHCVHCKAEIARNANPCPKCGGRYPAVRQTTVALALLAVLLVVGIAVLVVSAGSVKYEARLPVEEAASRPPPTYTTTEHLAPHSFDGPAVLGRNHAAAKRVFGPSEDGETFLLNNTQVAVVYKGGKAVRLAVTFVDFQRRGPAAAHLAEVFQWLSLDKMKAGAIVYDDSLSNLVTFSLKGYD